MKGVFIHQQIEFRLEVSGDEFRQGDTLNCSFTVKNHGGAPVNIPDLYLELACGDLKKVKSKAADAFEPIAVLECAPPGELAPGAQASRSATVTLDRNCVVTEKSQSLYLLFGSKGLSGADGQLLVTVQPHQYAKAINEIIDSSFQFVHKGDKSDGAWMNSKFKAPSIKLYASLEEMTVGYQFDGDALLLKFVFKVKKFSTVDVSSISVRKGKSEATARLERSDYLIGGEFLNHEGIEAAIKSALEPVENRMA